MLAVGEFRSRPSPGAPTLSRLENIWPGKQNYVPYTSQGGTRSMISVTARDHCDCSHCRRIPNVDCMNGFTIFRYDSEVKYTV